LRQGRFGRRRVWRGSWRIEAAAGRRIAALTAALLCATVGLGVADLFRHAHAAGRLEREARALSPARAPGGARPASQAGFGAMSSLLFDALRATPNVDLAAIDYQGAGGTLSFTVRADSAASAEALRERLAGMGYRADLGAPRQASGQTLFPLVLRQS
jgi:hypothetical protein